MKPGRNDPCPCGSELKYKKCCGITGPALNSEQKIALSAALAQAVELHQSGRLEDAAACYREVLARLPEHGDATHLLGVVEYQLGNYESAISLIQKAIPLLPGFAEAYINLGAVYMDSGRLTEAVSCFEKALAIQPNNPKAHMNLGNVYLDKAILDKTLTCYRKALTISPNNIAALSSLLFLLQYDPQQTLASLAVAHQEWERRHGRPPQRYTRHGNGCAPERTLRIGYVSPDFGSHPIGYFLLPVLKAHDRNNVTVMGYSNRLKNDVISDRLKEAADEWRSITGLNDLELSKQIRADRIDILVDMAGHTANNSLSLFALHPVPLQVTWAGYMGTTGLSQMDYLLTNKEATPPDTEKYYSEKFLFLPEDYICYEPPEYAPPVAELPALSTGCVTFGCFHNLAKVNENVVFLWSRLLKELPDAKLVMTTKQFDDAETCRRYLKMFAKNGVADRVKLEGALPHKELLAHYNQIDIALDPFPYTGALSTLESLWMGVPVVTLAGEIMVGRQSMSHVAAVGLTELISESEEEYLQIAVKLANDLPRLSALRSGLREKMKRSVCDGPRFTRNLEAAYREIWIRWCNEQ